MEYYQGQPLDQMSEQEWRSFALAQLQRKQKPLRKLWGLAKAILDIDPDVLMLVEVGGKESLQNFNQYFLGQRYKPLFVEGNSRRNIDLGFLVKKELQYQTEARSNKETEVEVANFLGKHFSRFSRDVAELRLYDGQKLKLIILLAHLKSMLSTDQDFRGKDTRTGEAEALVRIYKNLRSVCPGVPIIVGGDLNANISSLELEFLKRSDLVDFHDYLQTPAENRVSLVYFDYSGKPVPNILDYLLISPDLCGQVVRGKSYTYRYKGFFDIPEGLPDTPQVRYKMPSDHYPLVLTVKLN
ncbi:MAG: endonuclease/exonuclease/phosphatase family protein [Bdellovibrionia bacterium]